ncbi:unnamed protein product [Polarella glacialis]|uniref:EF-hand domain-containing protein n=1 Tax=Polarella glacialis TaxID=89957 RepID=A0A813JD38_POLGL|nr:unnamed protein product [Polarella glacialis]
MSVSFPVDVADFLNRLRENLGEAEARVSHCSQSVEAAWTLTSQRLSAFDSRLSALDSHLAELADHKAHLAVGTQPESGLNNRIELLESRFGEFWRTIELKCEQLAEHQRLQPRADGDKAWKGVASAELQLEPLALAQLRLRVDALAEGLAAEARLRKEDIGRLERLLLSISAGRNAEAAAPIQAPTLMKPALVPVARTSDASAERPGRELPTGVEILGSFDSFHTSNQSWFREAEISGASSADFCRSSRFETRPPQTGPSRSFSQPSVVPVPRTAPRPAPTGTRASLQQIGSGDTILAAYGDDPGGRRAPPELKSSASSHPVLGLPRGSMCDQSDLSGRLPPRLPQGSPSGSESQSFDGALTLSWAKGTHVPSQHSLLQSQPQRLQSLPPPQPLASGGLTPPAGLLVASPLIGSPPVAALPWRSPGPLSLAPALESVADHHGGHTPMMLMGYRPQPTLGPALGLSQVNQASRISWGKLHDGQVSGEIAAPSLAGPASCHAACEGASLFDKLDANHDGFLTREEFAHMCSR